MAGLLTTAPEYPQIRWTATPWLVSTVIHTLIVSGIVGASLFYLGELPETRSLTSIAVFSVPAPPPPEPTVTPAASTPRPEAPPPPAATQVPVEAPATITAEPPAPPSLGGVAGGISVGAPGGIAWHSGIPGGIAALAPPPAPVRPSGPVRVGGDIKAPELIQQVQPQYPPVALQARLGGSVIVEAVVDEQGRVVKTTIVKSTAGFFEGAALKAVREWRYRPMVLDGQPVSFILNVTVDFRIGGR